MKNMNRAGPPGSGDEEEERPWEVKVEEVRRN